MNRLLIAASTACALAAAAGCGDGGGSYPPTWKGFACEPPTAHAGDSVRITAVQAKKGKYLNATDYTWRMTVRLDADGETRDSTLSHSPHTNYDGTDNGDPVWELRLPEGTLPGGYTCSFSARWSNSADGEGGTYACTGGDGCQGQITSYSYTLYSEARGSFQLTVAQ